MATEAEDHCTIHVHARPDRALVAVRGELDLAVTGRLVSACREVLLAAGEEIRLDLSGLTFCDARGLSEIVRLRQRCEAIGRPLVLDQPTRSFCHLLELTNLTSLLLPNPPRGSDPLEAGSERHERYAVPQRQLT